MMYLQERITQVLPMRLTVLISDTIDAIS